MSLTYNSAIGYNEPNIRYVGTLIINVLSVSSPIIINNVNVRVSSYADNSNATVIGIITYDYSPSGVLEITTTQENAEALISFVNLNSTQQNAAEISLVTI